MIVTRNNGDFLEIKTPIGRDEWGEERKSLLNIPG
jgi:hypothetical protein